MSRCFPFPPPGYVLNGIRIRDEAMIDSIKGVELEKVKKEKKRDKKDKKERKKEKKEKKKRKERENGDGESEKHSHKRRRKDEGVKDVRELQEKTTCLDRSSLTVERELLQSSSQNSCDSTLNSNEKEKPKEQPPLVDGRHNNSNDSESIIRIRLPIRRQKDPEVMLMANKDTQIPREVKLDTTSQPATTTSEQQQQQPVNQHPCSTSAPEQASKPQQPVNQHPCSTSAPQHASKPPHEEKRKDHISTTKLSKEKLSTTKQSKEKSSSTKHSKEKISSSLSWTPEPYQPSRLCSICPPSLAAQFLNVVENWVPTTTEKRVELANSGDEECWWVMKKPSSHKFDTERCKQLNINNEIQQVTAWPCARLLPEADVHALPYTVPF